MRTVLRGVGLGAVLGGAGLFLLSEGQTLRVVAIATAIFGGVLFLLTLIVGKKSEPSAQLATNEELTQLVQEAQQFAQTSRKGTVYDSGNVSLTPQWIRVKIAANMFVYVYYNENRLEVTNGHSTSEALSSYVTTARATLEQEKVHFQ